MPEKFWAIKHPEHGFYCGTWLTRVEAIAAHVNGRFSWFATEDRPAYGTALSKAQLADWNRCKRAGDRAVRVTVRLSE